MSQSSEFALNLVAMLQVKMFVMQVCCEDSSGHVIFARAFQAYNHAVKTTQVDSRNLGKFAN